MEDNVTESKSSIVTAPEQAQNVTLSQIESEIRFHLDQISQNVIEIGKRLIIAKSLVKHGQWQQWLEQNFQLSQNTAGRFMQVAERFSKSATSQTLNQSQMIALLSLPSAEETEKFIEQKNAEGTPVSNMSVKSLRKEIKKWNSEINKIDTNQFSEPEKFETIDVTDSLISQNQDNANQFVLNEPATSPLVVSDSKDSPNEFSGDNKEVPTIISTPTEIEGTCLIENISTMCQSLVNRENRDEILQTFAKQNSSQLADTIQNLIAIVSDLQALLKKN